MAIMKINEITVDNRNPAKPITGAARIKSPNVSLANCSAGATFTGTQYPIIDVVYSKKKSYLGY